MNRSSNGRNSGNRNAGSRRAAPAPAPRRKASYAPDEIDRYNTVDCGVSGGSAQRVRTGGGKKKKKKGCMGKILGVFCSVLLLAALSGIAYAAVMFSRLDRSAGPTGSQATAYIQQPAAAPAWEVKTDSSVTNILLIGADKNDDGTDGRSDSNMLLSIDSSSKTLRLVSFLRDTYLEIPGHGKNKLNAAYAFEGPNLTIATLQNNYRIIMDKYISTDFDNFAKIIDRMGGLDISMSQAACDAENQNMGSSLKPGVNHLNGKLALYYARIRAIDDDFGRTGRQREVIELMIKKMKTINPIEASKIMYDYLPYVKTNLSDTELVHLASIGVSVSGYKMETLYLPYANTYKDEDIPNIGDVLDPDLKQNCTLLRNFLYGSGSSDSSN